MFFSSEDCVCICLSCEGDVGAEAIRGTLSQMRQVSKGLTLANIAFVKVYETYLVSNSISPSDLELFHNLPDSSNPVEQHPPVTS